MGGELSGSNPVTQALGSTKIGVMSYDLEVWSIRASNVGALCPAGEWQATDTCWTYAGRGWQIVIGRSDRVFPEDIPEGVAATLPGIEYVTHMSVEGSAPQSALARADRIAKKLAVASHGVIFDPQADTVATPAGVKRLQPIRHEESFSILEMSWWFLESPVHEPGGRDRLLSCLENTLPETLPRRYGLWEPPQYVYGETGRAHFLQFLDEHSNETIVWYPHRPVVSVHLGFPYPLGASRRGFRANNVSIGVHAASLVQPGWNTQLHRAWIELSRLIRPFYGDVQLLSGFLRGGAGGYGIGPDTERHPVKSWWWRGVPTNVGSAVVLGESYQQLWPAFRSAANHVDGLATVTSEDWSIKTNIAEELGGVPVEIAQLESEPLTSRAALNARYSYPGGWPFGDPFLKS
jgi:hypothetical protein